MSNATDEIQKAMERVATDYLRHRGLINEKSTNLIIKIKDKEFSLRDELIEFHKAIMSNMVNEGMIKPFMDADNSPPSGN